MPFCPNCGAKVILDAAFCSQCGGKLTRKPSPQETRKTSEWPSDSTELDTFSWVFSWVLKTHINAITDLTKEVAPFFDSLIILRDNKILSVNSIDDVDEGTVENLLFRLPIARARALVGGSVQIERK